MPGKRAHVFDRFWRYVPRREPDECWLWTGGTTTGYGKIGNGGRGSGKTLAHRVSWEMHFGSIPPGLAVCHRCDTPACVNPAHLFLGTHQDNMDDMATKGRRVNSPRRGEHNGASRLTDAQVIEIRAACVGFRFGDLASVASAYGVSRSTVHLIVRGKIWKHLPTLTSRNP